MPRSRPLGSLWRGADNELATMTIKKTGAVTASVANTAKRVIVLYAATHRSGDLAGSACSHGLWAALTASGLLS